MQYSWVSVDITHTHYFLSIWISFYSFLASKLSFNSTILFKYFFFFEHTLLSLLNCYMYKVLAGYRISIFIYRSHKNYRFLWTFKCFDRWSDLENFFSQILHWYGLIPECDRLCRASSSERENLHPQPGQVQENGFSPVCRRKWAFKCELLL